MESREELIAFFTNGFLEYRSNLTVDCAIFGYHDGNLKLLLTKNKIITKWCLPGGYVKKNESLDQAAARVTANRTGIDNLFLKQFKTFGNPKRNAEHKGAFDIAKFHELTDLNIEEGWFIEDSISVGFYAITEIVNAQPMPDFVSSECAWFSVDQIPELGFDHNEMVNEALQSMRIHLYHFPIGKNLLPDKFTLKEIKQFYEVMTGKSLHASNFASKLITLGLIEKLDEKKNIGAHRSPTYYQFNDKHYKEALKEGLTLV